MIWRIASFEASNLLRRWPPYLYLLIFFLVSFTIFSIRSVIGGTGKEWGDSSLALYRIIWLISIFGMIPTAAYMGRAVCKDFKLGIYPIIFSKPISKLDYLAGRFLGAFLVVLVFNLGLGLGALVASWMPYVDPDVMGFNSLAYYVRPYLIAIIPNAFIMAALFFAIAVLTRRMFPVWAAGIVLFVVYSGATDWVETFDNLFWAALIDPFSYSAELLTVRYWTVVEKNSLLMPLSQPLLINRLLWCSLATGALLLAYRKFSFSLVESGKKGRLPVRQPARDAVRAKTISAPERFKKGFSWQILKGLALFELRGTVKSLGFLVILVSVLLLVMTLSLTAGDYLGTKTYPLTYVMVELVSGPFDLFMFIFVILIAGELVWKGRETGIDQICDCMPVSGWIPFVAKLLAAVVIQLLLMTDPGHLHLDSGLPRLLSLRAESVPAELLRSQDDDLCQLMGLCPVRPQPDQPQGNGQLPDDPRHLPDRSTGPARLRSRSLPPVQTAPDDLLRYERLRPLSAAVSLVLPLLGPAGGDSGDLHRRHRSPWRRHLAQGPVALCETEPLATDGSRAVVLRVSRHRLLHLLQHQYPQRLPAKRQSSRRTCRI
jgi:hypothetical protein